MKKLLMISLLVVSGVQALHNSHLDHQQIDKQETATIKWVDTKELPTPENMFVTIFQTLHPNATSAEFDIATAAFRKSLDQYVQTVTHPHTTTADHPGILANKVSVAKRKSKKTPTKPAHKAVATHHLLKTKPDHSGPVHKPEAHQTKKVVRRQVHHPLSDLLPHRSEHPDVSTQVKPVEGQADLHGHHTIPTHKMTSIKELHKKIDKKKPVDHPHTKKNIKIIQGPPA